MYALFVIVAQISDLHIRGQGQVLHHMPNTAGYLQRAIRRLNDLAPDLVLATGDLTETGADPEYRRLRALLRELQPPIYLLPGNHDNRAALRRVFHDHAYLSLQASHASFTIDAWPIRIVALDSSDDRYGGGYLDEERLSWLEMRLRRVPYRPTIIALHHPPFLTGNRVLDSREFVNVERLSRIVAAHHQVKRVVSGHIHTLIQRPWAGTIGCSAPSTSPQFALGRSPLGVGIESAGFLMHEFDWDAEISTSIVRLDRDPQAITA